MANEYGIDPFLLQDTAATSPYGDVGYGGRNQALAAVGRDIEDDEILGVKSAKELRDGLTWLPKAAWGDLGRLMWGLGSTNYHGDSSPFGDESLVGGWLDLLKNNPQAALMPIRTPARMQPGDSWPAGPPRRAGRPRSARLPGPASTPQAGGFYFQPGQGPMSGAWGQPHSGYPAMPQVPKSLWPQKPTLDNPAIPQSTTNNLMGKVLKEGYGKIPKPWEVKRNQFTDKYGSFLMDKYPGVPMTPRHFPMDLGVRGSNAVADAARNATINFNKGLGLTREHAQGRAYPANQSFNVQDILGSKDMPKVTNVRGNLIKPYDVQDYKLPPPDRWNWKP